MTAKILYDIKYFSLIGSATINYPEFIISNDNSIRETFYTENVLLNVGQLARSYNQEDAFAYCEFEYDTENKSEADIKKGLAEVARIKLAHLATFLSFLWYAKDNSICIYEAIIFIPEMENCVFTTVIKSLHSNCNGKFDRVYYEKSDMEYIKVIHEKYAEINPSQLLVPQLKPIDWTQSKDSRSVYAIDSRADEIDYGKFNCIERALHFLTTARNTEYLVYKIAYYIPILECLFTTDKQEVTQKVCERVSFYLEEERDKRIELYDFIKDAYEIRSTFLHGQKFHSKNITREILEPTSIRLDEIIRALLIIIIMVDSENFIGLEQSGNKKDKIEKRIRHLKYMIFN